jgi:DNA polymerase III alpha subunit
MRLDEYSNPIFTEKDLFNALYSGYKLNSNDVIFVEERTEDIKNLEDQFGEHLLIFETIKSPTLSPEKLDASYQEHWNMPEEYKNMDIEKFLVNLCPEEHYQRLAEELEEFRSRKMLDLLKWLKYFVDTCNENNVIWGVGRGSSVASYVLYLIGVHSIDPIKYNLDWQEFLR